MPKINIKVTIINNDKKLEQKYNAIFHPKENEIVYQEEDKTITKLKIENEKIKLRRNNNELEMEYIFHEHTPSKAEIKVKSLNKILNLELKTEKIIKKGKNIELFYKLEEDKFQYKLEVI